MVKFIIMHESVLKRIKETIILKKILIRFKRTEIRKRREVSMLKIRDPLRVSLDNPQMRTEMMRAYEIMLMSIEIFQIKVINYDNEGEFKLEGELVSALEEIERLRMKNKPQK